MPSDRRQSLKPKPKMYMANLVCHERLVHEEGVLVAVMFS